MKDNTLNAKSLNNLLKRVNLGGLIDECILKVESDTGSITAIDAGNSVIVSSSETIKGLAKGEYGISQISTLIKFLNFCKGKDLVYSVSEDKKWMTFRHKGHGKLSIVLLENEMVGTKLTDEPKIKKHLDKYPVSLTLKQRFADDAIRFIGLIPSQSVSFTVKKEKVVMSSSLTNEHQKFEVPIGEVKGGKEFSVSVYTEQVNKILSVIEIGKESTLYLRSEHPVVFAQDKKNIWALTPVVI